MIQFLLAAALFFSPLTFGDEKPIESLMVPRPQGEALKFEQMIEANLDRLEEFRFIKEWATKNGVSAYLFGGAATAFAVYSRWEKEFREGSQKFHKGKFDFKINSIFHFNQDVDILLNASVSQVLELQKELDSRFPYQKTTGGKTISVWEVRALHYAIGFKPAVIGNPDFENQNTDSNSSGLIELTAPQGGRSRLQDLRKTHPGEGKFFRDLMEGRITYYNTQLHNKTSRATAANPITISALRFIIKLYEYDLATDKASLEAVEKILVESDFPAVHSVRGSRRWIEKNGAKLLDNAVDVEKAWLHLQKLDLIKRMSIFGPSTDTSTLAWLLTQTPVRTLSLNKTQSAASNDATAADWGLKKAYLRITDFKDYERLRMGRADAPNLLSDKARVKLSLDYKPKAGEVWVGFYINQAAVEGKDFELIKDNGVRILNRKSLRLIPETLEIPRSNLIDLIVQRADPDFVAYLIRQNNLLSTLNEEEYTLVKQFVAEIDKSKSTTLKEKYSPLLLPLIIKYEHRESHSTPRKFIDYIGALIKDESLKKSQIALIVMNHVDDFFSLNPTFEEAQELKKMVRHGPPFVGYMNVLMKNYVHTADDYMKILDFLEVPTPSYRKRMSYFVGDSFEKFLEFKPRNDQIKIALDLLEPEARIAVLEKHPELFKRPSLSCDVLLTESRRQLTKFKFKFEL